jgi:hypothetical protein
MSEVRKSVSGLGDLNLSPSVAGSRALLRYETHWHVVLLTPKS